MHNIMLAVVTLRKIFIKDNIFVADRSKAMLLETVSHKIYLIDVKTSMMVYMTT